MVIFKPTPKGLLRAEFKDRFGALCAIQESSRPEEETLWVGVEVGLDGEEIRYGKMLLTREMAEELIPILRRFARTGQLGTDDLSHPFQVGSWVIGVSEDNRGTEGRVIATGSSITIQDYTHPGQTHTVAWEHIELHWEPCSPPTVVPSRYDRINEDDSV